MIKLVFEGKEYSVGIRELVGRCEYNDTVQLVLGQGSYLVQSQVKRDTFELFIRFLKGENIIVNEENYEDLLRLGKEFSSHQLLSRAKQWKDEFEAVDADDFLEMGQEVSVLQKQIEGMSLVLKEANRKVSNASMEELIDARRQIDELKTEMKLRADEDKRVIEEQRRVIEELKNASRQQIDELKTEMKLRADEDKRAIEQQLYESKRHIEELQQNNRRVIEELRNEMIKMTGEQEKRVMEQLRAFELKTKTRKIVYSGNPWNGIIHYLTRESARNVIDAGVIRPIYSSVGNSTELPRNIVDFDNSSDFCSKNEPNSYVGYDFKEKRIKPTSYTIRSYDAAKYQGSDHLKSWVIETSNDNRNWKVIHRVDNNSDLNGNLRLKTWTITASDFCRFIRVKQTGPNHLSRHYLQISAFEVFGELITE